MNTPAVLVTGGAGYIGSHTTLALLEAGFEVVVYDNFCNSSPKVIDRLEELCGKRPKVIEGDVRDEKKLKETLTRHAVVSVLHFAGLKSVAESVAQPIRYYENNVGGTLTLCAAMKHSGAHRLVFSSSATVYGSASRSPISEDAPVDEPLNPYGRSKLMAEKVLADVADADPGMSIAVLRYFNPSGAHSSGLLGESPVGIPNNLVPYIARVATGELACLRVFGDDYPTPDGTGVRDYIHVQDLANGHLKALAAIGRKRGIHTWNLGTGQGYSVLEVVRAFEQACGKSIAVEIAGRRPGDVPESWADPTKAKVDLGWQAEMSLAEMMRDSWNWQFRNPNGFA